MCIRDSSYVDQNREGIDPNKKLWEVVSDGLDSVSYTHLVPNILRQRNKCFT